MSNLQPLPQVNYFNSEIANLFSKIKNLLLIILIWLKNIVIIVCSLPLPKCAITSSINLLLSNFH